MYIYVAIEHISNQYGDFISIGHIDPIGSENRGRYQFMIMLQVTPDGEGVRIYSIYFRDEQGVLDAGMVGLEAQGGKPGFGGTQALISGLESLLKA